MLDCRRNVKIPKLMIKVIKVKIPKVIIPHHSHHGEVPQMVGEGPGCLVDEVDDISDSFKTVTNS